MHIAFRPSRDARAACGGITGDPALTTSKSSPPRRARCSSAGYDAFAARADGQAVAENAMRRATAPSRSRGRRPPAASRCRRRTGRLGRALSSSRSTRAVSVIASPRRPTLTRDQRYDQLAPGGDRRRQRACAGVRAAADRRGARQRKLDRLAAPASRSSAPAAEAGARAFFELAGTQSRRSRPRAISILRVCPARTS